MKLVLFLVLLVSGVALAEPVIPALSARTSLVEWETAFRTQTLEAGLDSFLPVVFHGSPLKFEQVRPSHSTRLSQGKINWEGDAIFATADPRVALFYTYSRVNGFGGGINLIDFTPPRQPITYYLYGGQDQNEALDKLYGGTGYIYALNKQFYYREPGLGKMECISRDPGSNLWRIEVDRRREIDALVASGRVILKWSKD